MRQHSSNCANEPVPQPKRNRVPRSTALRAEDARPAGRFGARRGSAAFQPARALYPGNYKPMSRSSKRSHTEAKNFVPHPNGPGGMDSAKGRRTKFFTSPVGRRCRAAQTQCGASALPSTGEATNFVLHPRKPIPAIAAGYFGPGGGMLRP